MKFMVHKTKHNHMHRRNRRLGISGKETVMTLRFWNRSLLLRIHFHEPCIIRIYTVILQTNANNILVKPNTLAQKIRIHYKRVARSLAGWQVHGGNESLTNNEKNNPVSRTNYHLPPL